MIWIERETVTYKLEELPFNDEGQLAIDDPSKVCVVVSGYVYSVDIGAWCYTKRRKPCLDTSSKRRGIVQVDTKSFRPARLKFIGSYLEYLFSHIKIGKSEKSLGGHIGQFQSFLVWCDQNAISVLDSKEDFVNAAKKHTDFMMDKVKKSQISVNTAATLQLVVFTAGREVFNDSYGDLFFAVRKIKRSYAATKVTEKPNDILAKKTLKVYQDLFEQLSDFVLDYQLFPKKIQLDHGEFWFFPNSVPFAGMTNLYKKEVFHRRFTSYDYETGKIRATEDILNRMNWKNGAKAFAAENSRRIALSQIEVANGNRFHNRRVMAATLALQAFIMMFSANTGMGLGLISSLNWQDNQYDLDKNIQGFRTVKYRANDKLVTFMITSSFVPVFKKFIKLRKYLLDSFNYDGFKQLFFEVVSGKPRILTMSFSTLFHEKLRTCFDYDAKVTTRMWRAYKSDWLIRNSDVSTTSMVLQNTPMTVMKHYSQGSQVQAEDELSTFFEQYKQRLITTDREKTTSISVGQCSDTNHPIAIYKSKVAPNCAKPEGCLFCNKYRVHTDEIDVRKLLSCRYVIEKTQTVTHDENHFQSLFGSVLNQIDWIIEQIEDSKLLSTSVVNHVRKEVYELEKLDTYWLYKLELLEDLGVI
jgi:integrase